MKNPIKKGYRWLTYGIIFNTIIGIYTTLFLQWIPGMFFILMAWICFAGIIIVWGEKSKDKVIRK